MTATALIVATGICLLFALVFGGMLVWVLDLLGTEDDEWW
jgi:hypothetical protein